MRRNNAIDFLQRLILNVFIYVAIFGFLVYGGLVIRTVCCGSRVGLTDVVVLRVILAGGAVTAVFMTITGRGRR